MSTLAELSEQIMKKRKKTYIWFYSRELCSEIYSKSNGKSVDPINQWRSISTGLKRSSKFEVVGHIACLGWSQTKIINHPVFKLKTRRRNGH